MVSTNFYMTCQDRARFGPSFFKLILRIHQFFVLFFFSWFFCFFFVLFFFCIFKQIEGRKIRLTDAVGCTHIQKCLRFLGHHSTARRRRFHGQNCFCHVKFCLHSFCTRQKLFSLFFRLLKTIFSELIFRIFFNSSSKNKKKIIGTVFCPCKTNGRDI